MLPRQRLKYLLSDLLMTFIGWSIFYVYRYYATGYLAYHSLEEFFTSAQVQTNLLICPWIWLLIYAISGYYARPFFKSHLSEIFTTLFSVMIGGMLFFFVMVIDDIPFIDDESLGAFRMLTVPSYLYMRSLFAMWGCIFLPVMFGRYLITALTRRKHPDPMEHGIVCKDIGQPEEAYRFIYKHLPSGRNIFIQPSREDFLRGSIRTSSVTVRPMLVFGSQQPLSDFRLTTKRLGDIVISALALLLLIPVFAILAVWIKCDSHGPVFYRQERIGLCRRPFMLWKFRSMCTDSEVKGPMLSTDNDPRATRIGRFMRKYRLDELPQFWNILRGDMSLVGPRPERQFFIDQIMEQQPVYAKLLQFRPGLTSWGMVKYGYAQNIEQMLERMQYDLVYIDNCSLVMDLKIMAYTVKTVVTGKGV